ncbi:MAG: succinate dehydrogenase, cytochrome b556 subunit [Caulobacteraceae bacterium]|nr:succinate dehydrogenase, cytochrome b556 subunit [Caulobacteraceae bacterium]
MSEAKANSPGGRARPLSPHMQVWRWHLTMLTSILHRATGVALYAGAIIAAGWALSLASGAQAYADYLGALGSPIGKLVLLGLTLSAFYHLGNGIRHLVWDAGKGFEPRTASASGAAVIAFAIAATAAVWACAFVTGAL